MEKREDYLPLDSHKRPLRLRDWTINKVKKWSEAHHFALLKEKAGPELITGDTLEVIRKEYLNGKFYTLANLEIPRGLQSIIANLLKETQGKTIEVVC